MAKATSAKPHKMAWGVVRFFICLSFACYGARIADLDDIEDRQESASNRAVPPQTNPIDPSALPPRIKLRRSHLRSIFYIKRFDPIPLRQKRSLDPPIPSTEKAVAFIQAPTAMKT